MQIIADGKNHNIQGIKEKRARGLVVMTSLSHSEGRRFKSGRAHFLSTDFFTKISDDDKLT